MSCHQPIRADDREVIQIDALQRALRGLRHWAEAMDSRRSNRDEPGRRLYLSAARLHDEAWVDCLAAAYRLFEIEAIHQAWAESGGGPE